MLTKKEILEQLQISNVDMGKNPERTLVYYQQLGILPQPEKHELRRREAVFPDYTVRLIKNIRSHLNSGGTLAEFRKGLENNRKDRTQICRLLGIDNENQGFTDLDFSGTQNYYEKGNYIVATYPEKMVFFKVNKEINLIVINDRSKIEILDQITVSMDEYRELSGEAAVQMAKEQKLHFSKFDILAYVLSQKHNREE